MRLILVSLMLIKGIRLISLLMKEKKIIIRMKKRLLILMS